MSHPDPYGSEPRGWDRAERPVALPWPEQDLEAGQWSRRPTAGPELYADPHTRPYADPNPYDERGRAVRPDDRDRFDDRDPRDADDRNQPDRYDERGRRPLPTSPAVSTARRSTDRSATTTTPVTRPRSSRPSGPRSHRTRSR